MRKKRKIDFQENEIFFESLLENLPAYIIINQIDNINDPTTSFNLYSSPEVLKYIGYSMKEIREMGFKYFMEVMYPEDGQIIREAMEKLIRNPGGRYGGFIRIKSKDGTYQWIIAVVKVYKMKDGNPYQFLFAGLNLNDLSDTRFQISALVRENSRSMDESLIQSLTRRETEITRMIVNGMTNKEIANHLNISPKTVKTHKDNIHRKLGFMNNAALVHFAITNQLI